MLCNIILQTLGSFACSAIPFIQTSSILIGSMSLVAIALDRYLAVLNKSQSKISQSKVFCFSGLFVVWGFSFVISCPMLFGYEIYEVIIVPEENQLAFYKAYMCITDMVRLIWGENWKIVDLMVKFCLCDSFVTSFTVVIVTKDSNLLILTNKKIEKKLSVQIVLENAELWSQSFHVTLCHIMSRSK